ncbi:hypothetical protein LOZ53_000120 [Ophidiomyces ophidiicola]|nr:hypothetical protein LOZ53_000120 [Ophidiomyces ophidiicola]
MGFKFSYVCDLLSTLDNNRTLKAASEAKKRNPDSSTVLNWFDRHEKKIHSGDTDRLALLSCIFPEKRPERVFRLREASLVKVIGRCLLLGACRKQELDRWRERGWGDLGQCVEHVMRQAENQIESNNEVTVEEIDLALAKIASRCRHSGPAVRYQYDAVGVDETLSPIFRRLSSRDGKWLTRLIIKDFSPVVVPSQLVFKTFHFLLPNLLLFQNSLSGALKFLDQDLVKSFPPRPERQYASHLSTIALPYLKPEVGVKVGRVDFFKARSLQHCCQMAEGRVMSVEKKYDGEYCQVHINLSGPTAIQIFSKSGKDSTADRLGAHRIVKESLRIGQSDCRFFDRCIVECEVLVWSDAKSKILPFHKLRSHIPRSGSFIGIENDSPPDQHEHLYLAFFDVLLVDDKVCLSQPYRERRQILQDLVKSIEGYSEIAKQQVINFSYPDSFDSLKDAVAMAAAQRWEGLVLKGNEEPYFPIFEDSVAKSNFGRWIKLKKEYIPGLGDSADFALVGARYDANDANKMQTIKKLLWTSFFVGCLETTQQVSGIQRQVFRVIDVINRHNIGPQLILSLNQLGQFQICDPTSSPFLIKSDQPQIPEVEVLFRMPFVVEMVGSCFERPQDVRYYTLRFPRVLKIHSDRSVDEAITFAELQRLAETSRTIPEDELSQEIALWNTKLDGRGGISEYIVDDSDKSSSSSSPPNSPPCLSFQAEMTPGLSFVHKDRALIELQGSHEVDVAPRYVSRRSTGTLSISNTPNTQGMSNKRQKLYHRNNSQVINILPDHTEHAFSSKDSCPSTTAILADVSGFAAKTNQQNCTPLGIPCTTSTPGSPLSSLNSFNLENFPEHLNSRHLNATGVTSKNMLEFPSFSQQSVSQVEGILKQTSTEDLFRNASQGLIEGTAVKNDWILHNIPILFGSSLSKGTFPMLNKYLQKLKRSAAMSVSQFLIEITARSKFDSSFCDKLKAISPSLLGVVLVDSKNGDECRIASEIACMGNKIVNCRQREYFPKSGKIVFVQWRILQLAASSRGILKPRREAYGKAIFAGCLKWGYGASKKRRRKEIHSATDTTPAPQDQYSRVERGIKVSLDWQEILPLVQRGCFEPS